MDFLQSIAAAEISKWLACNTRIDVDQGGEKLR
jgi:hypothetical protein